MACRLQGQQGARAINERVPSGGELGVTPPARSPQGLDTPSEGGSGADDALAISLREIHRRHRGNDTGAVARYIPELAHADPGHFGLAVATTDGRLHTIGDAQAPFTIQSVSKAFAFCLALEMLGREEVLARVGVEPSGDAFNAIVFDPRTNRPFNPMVNAGAITVSAMIRE
ncbi:MAG: glutaminase, partial [Alphaproteobacteria bacterium]|nr:glutaminase [Alphaproteobacteria bacterium]